MTAKLTKSETGYRSFIRDDGENVNFIEIDYQNGGFLLLVDKRDQSAVLLYPEQVEHLKKILG